MLFIFTIAFLSAKTKILYINNIKNNLHLFLKNTKSTITDYNTASTNYNMNCPCRPAKLRNRMICAHFLELKTFYIKKIKLYFQGFFEFS